MKKLLLFSAFAVVSTLFSCTSDDYDTQAENKTQKITKPVYAGDDKPDGPGDGQKPPMKP